MKRETQRADAKPQNLDLNNILELVKGGDNRTFTLPITLSIHDWLRIAELAFKYQTTPAMVLNVWLAESDSAGMTDADFLKGLKDLAMRTMAAAKGGAN